jgi:hypothetical protein
MEEEIGSTDEYESDYNPEEDEYDFADGFVVDTNEADYHRDPEIMAMLATLSGRRAFIPTSRAKPASRPAVEEEEEPRSPPARRSSIKRRKKPLAAAEPALKRVKRRKVIRRKVPKKNM